MSTPEVVAPPRLKLGTALRAHVLLIVVLGLMVAAMAGAAAYLAPKEYVATAAVLVQPLDGNPYSPDGAGSDLTRLETEAQVVSSDVIVEAVRSDLPESFAQANLSKGLGVSIPPNTQIIQVTYRAKKQDIAVTVASQYAATYLDYRRQRRDTYLSNRQAGIDERLANLQKTLAEERDKGRGINSPEITSITAQMQNLRLQSSTVGAAETDPGQVISEPVARLAGLALPVNLAVPGGFVLGAVLASAFAVARERRRDLIRSVDDIEHVGIPVLGHVGVPLAEFEGGARTETDLSDAALMVAAVLTRRVKAPATVAVSGVTEDALPLAFPDELARALAQGQQPVLLVDGASTEPTRQPGLSEALKTSRDLDRLIRRRGGRARMSVGRAPHEGSRLYGTPRMDDLLERATQQYDWVVVHASATDQMVGRSLVGGCAYWVPVVVLGHTSRDDLERGLQWARTTGTHPLGVVAIEQTPARRSRDEAKPEPDAPSE